MDAGCSSESAEADLRQNSLTSEQFGSKTDKKAQHGKTPVPGLGEVDESKTCLCVFRHGRKTRWLVEM